MGKAIYVQPGKSISYKNDTAEKIEYGDVVNLTTCIGVAVCDIPTGGVGTLTTVGVFEMPATTGELSVGAKVYWDAANETATSVVAGNTPCGIVIEAKAASATTALVKIG